MLLLTKSLLYAALLVLFPFTCNANPWQHVFHENANQNGSDGCFLSRIDAFETVKTPIWLSTSPLDSFERPKMSAVNGSAWEQWYFDSVSSSGKAGFGMAFARDPSYKPFGQGVLRVEVSFVFENGTQVQATDFLAESRVQDCCGEVHGLWNSTDRYYAFHISADLKEATVSIDTPKVKGSFTIHSYSPARYPDGSTHPSTTASTDSCPFLHFTESIPTGAIDFDFLIGGEPLVYSGLGGHNHLWAAKNWFDIVQGWYAIRGNAGPYSWSLWSPTSKINPGVVYPSAFLIHDGEKIFSTQKAGKSDTEDYMIFGLTFGGSMHSSIGDISTGWTMEFVSPSQNKKWRFETEHNNVAFEMGLGERTGLTAFVDTVEGGEVGGEVFQGVSIGEQVLLPEKFGVWMMAKIWWAHVSHHKEGVGKAVVQTLLSYWKYEA